MDVDLMQAQQTVRLENNNAAAAQPPTTRATMTAAPPTTAPSTAIKKKTKQVNQPILKEIFKVLDI